MEKGKMSSSSCQRYMKEKHREFEREFYGADERSPYLLLNL